MNEPNLIWRYIRSLLFVFGAGFIIFLQIQPSAPHEAPLCFTFAKGSFPFGEWTWCPRILEADLFFRHWIFIWCAAFVHRRPGSTNETVLFFVALVYALYIDEGLALGAFALVAMVAILRKYRDFMMQQMFVVELFISAFVYLACIIFKNIVLFLFRAPHFDSGDFIPLLISFLISYPILNVIIIALVRSRKERSLTI